MSGRSRGMRLIGIVFVALAAILALQGGNAQAQDKPKPVIINMLISPLGAGPLEGQVILGTQIAREHPWLILRAQETPGYLYNIREMATNKPRWKDTVFATEDTVIQLAFQGGAPILKDFLPEPIKIKWKLLYGEAYWTQGMWFVTLDPAIKTLSDIKGKSVAVGLRTQCDWGMDARLFLEIAYGVTPANTKIEHLPPVTATEAMLDGKVKVAVMGAGGGVGPDRKDWLLAPPIRTLQASGRKPYYLGVSEEDIKKVNQQLNTSYQPTVIKAGTLYDQPADLHVGIDRGYIGVHPEFPEEVAYEIVKQVAKFGPKMGDLHGLWKVWSPELMIDGLTEETAHPGAIRAYKELGWWDKAKKFKPVEYPKE
jgi:uncharacterized protein